MKALFPKNLITCWDQAITRSAGIVLATHVNPDGDAVGAMTGLGLFLRQQGYRVTCICPSPYPGFLEFLDNGKNVLVFSHQKEEVLRAVDEANMLVAVDVSGLLRMEELGDVLSESRAFKVLMDHHIDPVMEDFDLVFSTPQVSSSCELIFRLLSAWKPKAVFSKEQATAFLTGIITDTNQFANSVYAETFNAASLLHRWGADSETIFSQVYQNFTLNRMHLMGMPSGTSGFFRVWRSIYCTYQGCSGSIRLPQRGYRKFCQFPASHQGHPHLGLIPPERGSHKSITQVKRSDSR